MTESIAELWPVVLALMSGGLVMGTLAGLLGVGGGGILVPILYEVFGYVGVDEVIRMHLSVGTSLAVIVPTSIRSAFSHHKRGTVDWDLTKSFALPVLFGVIVGIFIAKYSSEAVIKLVWVFAAPLIAAKLLFARDSWKLGDDVPGQPFRAIYGAFTGLISTLMSVGGGAFITAMMTLYGRSILQAVGTSSAFGPMIAIPGMIGFMWAGWHAPGLPPGSFGFVSLIGAAVIIPVSVLAAPLGVRIAHRISRRSLEIAFAVFLICVSLRFLISLLNA